MIRNWPEFARALPAGFDGVFDWDFLNVCWSPTRMLLSDIDAAIECGLYWLLFETKERGAPPMKGQLMALKRLTQLRGPDGLCPITLIQCAKIPDDIDHFIESNGGVDTAYVGTASDLVGYCRLWFLLAMRRRGHR